MYQAARHIPNKKKQSTFGEVVTAWLRGIWIAVALLVLLLLPSWSHGSAWPSVRATAGVSGRADFSDGRGSYRAQTWGVRLGWQQFYLDYDHTAYQWRDTGGMRFSQGREPWNNLNFARLGARLQGEVDDAGLGWFWDGGLIMGWEEQTAKSLGGEGSGGLSYQFTPDISGKVGVWGMAHPALYRILPVASLDWNMAGDPGPSMTLGFPETMFRYRSEDGVTLRAGARADLGERSYRLADDSHVYRKGYISTRGITAGMYLDVSPLEGMTASVGLEYDMERSYEIRSNNGKRRQTLDVENTPSLQFSLGFRF